MARRRERVTDRQMRELVERTAALTQEISDLESAIAQMKDNDACRRATLIIDTFEALFANEEASTPSDPYDEGNAFQFSSKCCMCCKAWLQRAVELRAAMGTVCLQAGRSWQCGSEPSVRLPDVLGLVARDCHVLRRLHVACWSSLPAAEWLIADRGYDADWFRNALKD